MTKRINTKSSKSGECHLSKQYSDSLFSDHIHVSYGYDMSQEGRCRHLLSPYTNWQLGKAEAFIRFLAESRGTSLGEACDALKEYLTADYSTNELYRTYYQEKKKQFLKLSATEQKAIQPGPNAKVRADLYIKSLKKRDS